MARKHVSFILHWVKRCRAAGLIMLAALLLPLPAPEAHPHVFIVQRLTLVFDAEGLAGIKVW